MTRFEKITIGAAFLALFISAGSFYFSYLDFDRTQPKLALEAPWMPAQASVGSEGIVIDWKFQIINESNTDAVITNASFQNLSGTFPGFLPPLVDGKSPWYEPVTVKSRESVELQIRTVHTFNPAVAGVYGDVIYTVSQHLDEQVDPPEGGTDAHALHAQNLFLSTIWEKAQLSDLKIPGRESFVAGAGRGCQALMPDSLFACIIATVTTIEGRTFSSIPINAGFSRFPDCTDGGNDRVCRGLVTLAPQSLEHCTLMRFDEQGNPQPISSDCPSTGGEEE